MKWIILSVALIVLIAAAYFVLRAVHVLLKIGGDFQLCTANQYMGTTDRALNDRSVKEIIYMKNLQKLALMETDITNINFVTKLTNLRALVVYSKTGRRDTWIKRIPPLDNSDMLETVVLTDINVKDLNFLRNLDRLRYFSISTFSLSNIELSALDGKQHLENIVLNGVRSRDFSVLLNLPALKEVTVDMDALPPLIVQKLEQKGIKVTEK